jgi:hypothetical protein
MAERIREAHAQLKAALGTDREIAARRYLEAQVELAKRGAGR